MKISLMAIMLSVCATAFSENLVPESFRNIRLEQKTPGKMTMKYFQVKIPSEFEGVTITAEVRCENVVKGDKPWFDARIMTDWFGSDFKKVASGPNLGGWNGTRDWFSVKKVFRRRDGAVGIALMPCLFNVKEGVMEIRNLTVKGQKTFVEDPVEKAARLAREKKMADGLSRRRAKAAEIMAQNGGSLIVPPKNGGPYVDLEVKTPGKMVNGYKIYDIPEGVQAMRFSGKWSVSNLKVGDKPWFDARILFKVFDANGKEMKGAPAPSYVQRDTKGFVERSCAFLIPEGAVRLVVMPTLFNAKSGRFIIQDARLEKADPIPLLAEKADRERQAIARRVADEEPDRAKWPKTVRVAGNRLVDPDGKEVWLQGVNAGGLESVPNGDQVVKSAVVAIDEWKANSVRLPVNEAFWFGRSGYQSDGGVAYRKCVDKIVTLAANRGAYVVLDLHRFRAPKAEHVEFWKDAAAHYKDHPAVVFDLFNEPHGIDWKTWRDGGWVGEAGKRDESAFLSAEEKRKNQGFESVGMQALVDAVRSAGAKNVVIAGGLFWANDLTGIANDKGEPTFELSDWGGNGVMYAWHTYHWHKGWDRMLPVLAKHPVLLGEVGACPLGIMNFIPDKDQESPYTFVPDMLGFIQKHRINWTGWCFHPKAAPCMIENWDYKPTPYWGEFARRALAGEKFELKKMR